mgnify:CR=1 FL=1
MFNGIIFNQGKVTRILKRKKGINLFIKSNIPLKSKNLGLSVSCDGVCLTLVSVKNKILEFYLSNETLNRSKFKIIKKDDLVNLELPLKKGQKISGHICQGHVDFFSIVKKIKLIDKSHLIESTRQMHVPLPRVHGEETVDKSHAYQSHPDQSDIKCIAAKSDGILAMHQIDADPTA